MLPFTIHEGLIFNKQPNTKYMSSVVNKSGTRFAPKVRQRRLLTTAPTVKPTAITTEEEANDVNVNLNDDDEDATADKSQLNSEVHAANEISLNSPAEDTAGPKALPTSLNSDSPLQTSTQLPTLSSNAIADRRRSSRLDSLSNNQSSKPLFKPSFNEANSGVNGRRLSTISNAGFKKVKIGSTSEKDLALQALKRRRMSIRTSISKKSGSAHRISIVSRMGSPDTSVHTATAIPNPDGKKESSTELFQRTDSLYEKYTIKNLKEIPKNIQDADSERYLIDEEEFTMAELCKPKLPIGEPSENFERAKMAGKAKVAKRKLRRDLRKRAREEFKSLNILSKEEQEQEQEERRQAAEKLLSADIPEFGQGSHAAIQLKLNPDGTMVVDEDSTVVDRHKNASFENAHKQKLDENPFENLFNSGTYGRNMYTDPWTTEELVKFYKALSMWGTDFNLIAQLFPYRTRKQVKAKFVNEERKHPVIVDLALRSRLPPNFEQYCIDTKKEIGTISQFHEKLEELKERHDEHMKAIDAAKLNAKEEDLQNVKTVDVNDARKKTSGGFRADQLKAYRKSEIVLGTIDDMKRKPADDVEGEKDT